MIGFYVLCSCLSSFKGDTQINAIKEWKDQKALSPYRPANIFPNPE